MADYTCRFPVSSYFLRWPLLKRFSKQDYPPRLCMNVISGRQPLTHSMSVFYKTMILSCTCTVNVNLSTVVVTGVGLLCPCYLFLDEYWRRVVGYWEMIYNYEISRKWKLWEKWSGLCQFNCIVRSEENFPPYPANTINQCWSNVEPVSQMLAQH